MMSVVEMLISLFVVLSMFVHQLRSQTQLGRICTTNLIAALFAVLASSRFNENVRGMMMMVVVSLSLTFQFEFQLL